MVEIGLHELMRQIDLGRGHHVEVRGARNALNTGDGPEGVGEGFQVIVGYGIFVLVEEERIIHFA